MAHYEMFVEVNGPHGEIAFDMVWFENDADVFGDEIITAKMSGSSNWRDAIAAIVTYEPKSIRIYEVNA